MLWNKPLCSVIACDTRLCRCIPLFLIVAIPVCKETSQCSQYTHISVNSNDRFPLHKHISTAVLGRFARFVSLAHAIESRIRVPCWEPKLWTKIWLHILYTVGMTTVRSQRLINKIIVSINNTSMIQCFPSKDRLINTALFLTNYKKVRCSVSQSTSYLRFDYTHVSNPSFAYHEFFSIFTIYGSRKIASRSPCFYEQHKPNPEVRGA